MTLPHSRQNEASMKGRWKVCHWTRPQRHWSLELLLRRPFAQSQMRLYAGRHRWTLMQTWEGRPR